MTSWRACRPSGHAGNGPDLLDTLQKPLWRLQNGPPPVSFSQPAGARTRPAAVSPTPRFGCSNPALPRAPTTKPSPCPDPALPKRPPNTLLRSTTVMSLYVKTSVGPAEGRATNDQTMSASSHSSTYLATVARIAHVLEPARIDAMATGLARVRERGGRLFILGVGGGRATRPTPSTTSASSADRELHTHRQRLGADGAHQRRRLGDLVQRVARGSRLRQDALLVFSVGGGYREHNVSVNLVSAIELRREASGASIYGVVGAPAGARRARRRRDRDRPAPRSADAAGGVVPGGRVARAGLPSGSGASGRALGVARPPSRDERPRGVPRPRRRAQRARRRLQTGTAPPESPLRWATCAGAGRRRRRATLAGPASRWSAFQSARGGQGHGAGGADPSRCSARARLLAEEGVG